MHNIRSHLRWSRRLALLACLLASSIASADLKQSLDVVESTNRTGENSQQRIDALSRETRILLEEYRSLKDSSEYQEAYARELQQLDASQQDEIESLSRQVAQARVTRQRILPLMRSMADALEQFVVLDLPFHQQQRVTAVVQLKQRMDRPDLSVAARFRLLLEAYQIEQDYSRTVEAWRGPLQIEGENLSVEYLRIGRAALYYQSLDRERSAWWNRDEQAWQTLPVEHGRALTSALRVARNEIAPELMLLPFPASGGVE